MTALHWASTNGHSEIVHLLLHYHADPDICTKVSYSITSFIDNLLLYRMVILHCILPAKKVI